MRRLLLCWLAALTAAALSSGARGDIVLSALDSGFVTSAGGSAKGDGTMAAGAPYNYSVGYEVHYTAGALGVPPGSAAVSAMDRNNYFVFDLSAVGAPIVSATLVLPAGMLESVDGMEVFDVLAPMAPGMALADAGTLKAAHGMGTGAFDSPMDPAVGMAAALYGNIEGGAALPLASKTILPSDDFGMVSITLSPLGVAYLNGFLGGPVILGGSVPSIVTASGTPQQPFGFTAPMIPGAGSSVPKLVVTAVPEAGAWLLVGGVVVVGAAGRGVVRRRSGMA
jgi:hypothetical protein